MTETYTLAELAARIGTPMRSAKFWTDSRVIKPLTEYAGRGTPRVFDIIEARVASLLVPFAEQGLPIGALAWLGEVFRRCLAVWQQDDPRGLQVKSGDRLLVEALDRAIAGQGDDWLAIADSPQLRLLQWRPLALISDRGAGLQVPLDALIPTRIATPDGTMVEIDRGATVVMLVSLTARLSLLR
jgi:hypothetical protein